MLPGVVGLIQATEIIKLILENGVPLIGRLLLYDAMKMNFKEVRVRKDPQCALCGDHPSVKELIDYQAFCDIHLPGQVPQDDIDESLYELTPLEFKKAFDADSSAVMVDVRETFEWDICRIEGSELLPLSKFDPATSGLDPDTTIFLYCYMGKRSMLALKELKRAGFKKLKNLSGGIDLWAEEVDTDMPRY
ncbi:MAG: hypothetical protein H8E38_14235 [SAR324 cluster bacterium]|nr:hypothetical protein [SAR324 cluster bacterium]MBL7034868.1 hypothetical protein [SAR324 cluster bacterium]